MREFKFRVWSEDRKMFIMDGMSIDHIQKDAAESLELPIIIATEKCIWQQYTGLKDKNGKEIYEGDIVLYPHKSGGGFSLNEEKVDWVQCEVKWKAGGLAAYWGYNDSNIATFNNKNFIVVGNIFENSELLNEPNS
jgi:uncharacterized phage protein (TIGR01671 family)